MDSSTEQWAGAQPDYAVRFAEYLTESTDSGSAAISDAAREVLTRWPGGEIDPLHVIRTFRLERSPHSAAFELIVDSFIARAELNNAEIVRVRGSLAPLAPAIGNECGVANEDGTSCTNLIFANTSRCVRHQTLTSTDAESLRIGLATVIAHASLEAVGVLIEVMRTAKSSKDRLEAANALLKASGMGDGSVVTDLLAPSEPEAEEVENPVEVIHARLEILRG